MRRFINFIKRRLRREPKAGPGPKETESQDAKAMADSALQQKAIQAQGTAQTLQVTLKNNTSSGSIYAYITGQALDNNNALLLLQSDGQTPYYPTSPDSMGSPLQVNCAIALGAPGGTVTVTIPHIANGRIWFAIDSPLMFLLNLGPALVEPSVTNPNDPNIDVSWAFAEFTYDESQLYANISFVDFVSLPISIDLLNASGVMQTVGGLPADGLAEICEGLTSQTASDGNQGWSNLVVYGQSGQPLRVLSPNNGMLLRPEDFAGYYDAYVDEVLARYQNSQFTLLTNNTYACETTSSTLKIGDSEVFQRPSTADIFSSNSGPFVTGQDSERNTIIPNLASAFNRSTLLVADQIPSPLSTFYQDPTTNHFSRIVHSVVIGGKGYAFPYDDVPPSDGSDQSGYVSDSAPVNLTLTVGGS